MVNTNVIYCGDCKKILRQLPEECVDFIYADPPFFSNRKYEVIWDDGAELRSFEDRWKGGIRHYEDWMAKRLEQCYRVLKNTGSMYLHCDWHAVYYLKTRMDKIFRENQFKNEIIWQRTKSHNDPKQYGRIHDNILFYTKSKEYTWNEQYLPYEEEYIEKAFRHADKSGRRYQTQPLHASKPGGDTYYEWKGKYPPKGRYWAFSKANMKKMDNEGRIHYSRTGVPRYKIYVDEAKGRPLQDLWTDIPGVHHMGKERLGYPTQKPEALLERMIKASSNKGDIILDPFCGCGTTIAVAHKLKRKWIGIDVSPTACKLMRKRMSMIGVTSVPILGLPTTKAHLRKIPPFEFQNWVLEQLRGKPSSRKSGDMGIDGMILGTIPVQVKQSRKVGRNVVDNFETAIQRRGKKKGIIVAFSFVKSSYEEVARARTEHGLDIILLTVDDLLKADFDPMKFLK